MGAPERAKLCDVARQTHITFAEPEDAAMKGAMVSTIGSQSQRELFSAAMDSARSGQENRQYAGSSSMFGILQDAHMRSVREHNVVAPQRNDMVQAATASAAQNRQAFLKQKQLLQAGSGVHATMHADGPEWHRQRAPKVLSKEDAVSHLHQAAQDRLDLPVDADTGKHVPSAKIVTVRRHLMCGGTGPNTADDRTEGNAVLHSRWKSKFAEIGAKPGHGDLASATDRAPNRGGDEVKKVMQRSSLALSMPWTLDGQERQLSRAGPLGTK